MGFPVLKDWRGDLDKQIRGKGQSQQDLLAVIHICQELLENMQPAANFIQEQRSDIATWLSRYQELYMARFKEQPPPRPSEELPDHMVLDTPQKRKQAIRQAALTMTEPGMAVGDKDVWKFLQEEGMLLVANNPTAAISTILNGFKSEFQKVDGKRGVFQRRNPPEAEA